ncbi:MAG: hypothetical protein WCP91_01545 [Candidatus Berkelbacteria bacterium]
MFPMTLYADTSEYLTALADSVCTVQKALEILKQRPGHCIPRADQFRYEQDDRLKIWFGADLPLNRNLNADAALKIALERPGRHFWTAGEIFSYAESPETSRILAHAMWEMGFRFHKTMVGKWVKFKESERNNCEPGWEPKFPEQVEMTPEQFHQACRNLGYTPRPMDDPRIRISLSATPAGRVFGLGIFGANDVEHQLFERIFPGGCVINTQQTCFSFKAKELTVHWDSGDQDYLLLDVDANGQQFYAVWPKRVANNHDLAKWAEYTVAAAKKIGWPELHKLHK